MVRVILGLLLLAAASLKAYDAIRRGGTSPIEPSEKIHHLVVAGELVLGLWLMSGKASSWNWFAAVSGFGCLALVSLRGALTGQVSCGCLGRIAVSPWEKLPVAFGASAALWLWPPRSN